ncbi:chaperone-mediated protein transport [Aureococcus anophagefferens]|uniref:Mitochondrial import inner membrane translocase subunit n=1 Tax=Aureococcus anophagefferens TaxID=44056 RepID=A0ABR1G7Y3_AURAN
MNALQNIPEHQKPEFMRSLETMQMKDSLKMYNNLVEQCFAHCVAARDGVSFERARRTAASFRSKALDKKEDECICRCAEKYIKLTQRVGFRFAEHQAAQGAAPSP